MEQSGEKSLSRPAGNPADAAQQKTRQAPVRQDAASPQAGNGSAGPKAAGGQATGGQPTAGQPTGGQPAVQSSAVKSIVDPAKAKAATAKAAKAAAARAAQAKAAASASGNRAASPDAAGRQKPAQPASSATDAEGEAFRAKQVAAGRPTSQKLSRVTLVAAVAAVLVAVIGWFATDGFGTNKLEPPQTDVGASIQAGQEGASSQAGATGATTIDEQVAQKMAALTLEQKVAQMFIVTPEALTGAEVVTAAGDLTRIAIDDRPVGGIIYNTQNLLDATQVSEMLATTQTYSNEACGLPMFLAIDEEGGEVNRIGDNEAFEGTDVGNMSDIGATGDADQARQAASTIGGYLTKLGFNLDFAPVADIANNPESETMLYRSFGSTADVVAPMVAAAVRGFSDAGILCCAKHFPGIGAALGDSHIAGITTEETLPEMQSEELVPFTEAINAGVPFIMVSHLSCPQVSGENTPASLSRGIVNDILRTNLAYNGLIITDSLAMGAVTESYDAADVGVMAIEAGNDIILMPENFDATFRGVLDAVADGRITEERINESVERIIKTKLTMRGV